MEKYIKILELPDSFDMKDLKKAYRKMAKKYHPDFASNPSEKVVFTQKMKDINKANEVLKDYLTRYGRYEKPKTSSSNQKASSGTKKTSSSNYNKSTTSSKQSHKKTRTTASATNFARHYRQETSDSFAGSVFTALVILGLFFMLKGLFVPSVSSNEVPQSNYEQVITEEDVETDEVEEVEEQENIVDVDKQAVEQGLEKVTQSLKNKESSVPQKVVQNNSSKYVQPVPQKSCIVRNQVIFKNNSCWDTDLASPPRERVCSSDAKYFAYDIKKKAENNHPDISYLGEDSLEVSVYVDFYGNLRYIQITEPPNFSRMESFVCDLFASISYRSPSYTRHGGDIKSTFKVVVSNGTLEVKVIKAENMYY